MGGTEKQKNIVIYTAIYNNYDDLKDPKVISSSCDYVCFTDNPKLRSNVWEIKYYPKKNLDPTRKNRKVKILPHLFLNYEYSVYIDGNIDIIGNIEELIEKYLIKKGGQMAAFDHLSCNCLYEEAKRCIERDKDNKNIIDKQISKYKKEGMPLNYGLIQNRILLRKHNDPTVIKTMEDWWQEIVNYSKRDQISFCYSTWKNNLEYITMEETFPKNNKYFSQRKHKQKGVDRIRQLTKENKEKNIFYKFLYHVGKISKKICNTLKIKMVF